MVWKGVFVCLRLWRLNSKSMQKNSTLIQFTSNFLTSRYPVREWITFLSHKEVPAGGHSRIWYYFGGLAMFFLSVQMVTGILLLMYYEVGENSSHESLSYMVNHVPFGWLIRSVHCWSSHLLIMSLLSHMFSVFFLKSYRKPRELTWVTGMALFGCVMGFGFSGYLLPWNELSFFATTVGTEVMGSIPVFGEWIREVARGGTVVSGNTLYRFFALHVCVLPLAICGILGTHLFFIQVQGMANDLPKADGTDHPITRESMKFFPNLICRDVALWGLFLIVLMMLSFYFPNGAGIPGMEWYLGDKADPMVPPSSGIKPEWYFLWMYQLLKLMPAHVGPLEGEQVGFLLTNGMLVLWMIVPFLDSKARQNRPSPFWTDFGVAVLLFCGYMTFLAWDFATVPIALATVGLAGLVNTCRYVRHKTSVFPVSTTVMVMAILHAFVFIPELTGSGHGFDYVLYVTIPFCLLAVLRCLLRKDNEVLHS